MTERQPAHMIHVLKRRWRRGAFLVHLLVALGLTAVISVLVSKAHNGPLWCVIPIGLVCLLALLLPSRTWRIGDQDVVRYFNANYPELEESCGLLLRPPESLGMLEQLQFRKIERIFNGITPPHPYSTQLRIALFFLVGAVIVSTAVYLWWHPFVLHHRKVNEGKIQAAAKEVVLPGITAVNITITPPAYTRKPIRKQQQFNLEAEEGARLQWEIHTSKPVPSLQLVLNDSGRIMLRSKDEAGTVWNGGITATRSGFYQVALAGQLSELYKLAVIKDMPPVISVQSPASYTVIDYGMPQRVTLKVSLTDDYGISAAGIQATLASGSGESVKFREQAIAFDAVFNGARKQYSLEKTVSAGALGMQPGGELYLYVQARDNHRQDARSGMYMIVLPDTAQLMSLEGLANSVNVKPEYFRSQRQIIIETGQLIRAKDTITEKVFRERSNDLGIDQQLLRLRYGRFLGEEFETNIGEQRAGDEEGHDHEHGHEAAADAKDFNNAEKIIDQFSHRHDIAEDATFFDAATKQQLKATLTEMWNAELRLRTFKPQEALPYEYKALRLLKDLQQKSRAYVGKTSIKTTPLKPEKRLTGELDKIILPVMQHQYTAAPSANSQLPQALAILETLKSGAQVAGPAALPVLQQASRQMSAQAAAAPGRYLASLQAMRQVIDAVQQQTAVDPAAITLAAQAIYDMVPEPVRLPQAARTAGNVSLSQQYFMNLNRQQ